MRHSPVEKLSNDKGRHGIFSCTFLILAARSGTAHRRIPEREGTLEAMDIEGEHTRRTDQHQRDHAAASGQASIA
jgi:hypothetical protein